jgi:hypothetical protein
VSQKAKGTPNQPPSGALLVTVTATEPAIANIATTAMKP